MIDISKNEKRIILEMYGVTRNDEDLLPSPPKESVPFKNIVEGNKFREWVNNKYPNIVKKIDLDRNSPYYNNVYINKAWNERIGNKTLGSIYKKYNSISDTFNQYLNMGKDFFGNYLNPKKSNYDAVLIGGLDHRPGDLSIDQQVEKFKIGYGNKNVKGFRHNTSMSEINKFLEENPRIPIFMFSQGCLKSYDLTNNKNVDKNKLFVIEPYAADPGTKNIVKSAVNNGIPQKNVFVGPTYGRGMDVVTNASSSEAIDHWSALNTVGQKKSNIA